MNPQKITWIDWILTHDYRGKYFIKVDSAYIRDCFNLYGLRGNISNYKYALEMIRGQYIPPKERPNSWPPDIDRQAIKLYGLIHARYLLTQNGLQAIYEKYKHEEFEPCPRVSCNYKGRSQCLPYGLSDMINSGPVHMYCPQCNEVYSSQYEFAEQIDGAYFGPSWIHLFKSQYLAKGIERPLSIELRLFGFKIDLESSEYEEEDSSEYETD